MKALRIALLALAVLLLLYGLAYERHEVNSLAGGDPEKVSGFGFTEAATYDGLMLKDGRIYDAYGLAPGTADQKDCKT